LAFRRVEEELEGAVCTDARADEDVGELAWGYDLLGADNDAAGREDLGLAVGS